jgi:hypothetical protein
MTSFWSVVFSPMGVGIYALFWILKLTVGAWVVRKTFGFLPDTAQTKMRTLFNFRRSARPSFPEQST